MRLTWDNLKTCHGCGKETSATDVGDGWHKKERLCSGCYAEKRREYQREFAERKYAKAKAKRNAERMLK